MDILAACCVPVFVQSLEELFYLFSRKAKLPDKKYVTVSSKRAKYSCQHEWVRLWSLVSTDCRHTHTHRHTHNHVAAKWQHTHIYILLKGRMYIYISFIIYTYIYICIRKRDHICKYTHILSMFVWCWNFSHMRYMLHQFCSGCNDCGELYFPFLYSQRSIEPMLPRIWRLCARLLHAIFLLMQ